MPVSAGSFFSFHSANSPSVTATLQHSLSAKAHKHIVQAAAERMKEQSRQGNKWPLAHHKAITAPGASNWKVVRPEDPHMRLSDVECAMAVRLNLGLKPFAAQVMAKLPEYCPLCVHNMTKQPVSLRAEPWHFLTCSRLAAEQARRHNAVVSAIARTARLVGGQVEQEARGLDPRSQQRADLQKLQIGRCVMSSPLAWQGDGPPQTSSASFSAHWGDQFDTSHSLTSLTFIAAQLSTLLHSVSLASSAASPLSVNPHLTASPPTSPHSPSPVLLPLSNSLTLCHSNLVAALSHVVATSFQLLTQPIHPALQPSPLAFIPAPQSVPAASFTSPSAPRSISIPPRFTIRVVTDLEPVTPPASQPSSPSSPIAPPASLPIPLIPSRRTSTAQPDAFSAEQSDVVVKATLHQVRAAATSPVSTAQQTADQNDNDCPSPDAAPTATPPPAASDHLPSPASPPTPPTSVIHVPTADAAVSVDESDVTVKAIPHPVSAAVISSPADSTQSASSDKDRDKDNKRSTPHTTCRPATPLHRHTHPSVLHRPHQPDWEGYQTLSASVSAHFYHLRVRPVPCFRRPTSVVRACPRAARAVPAPLPRLFGRAVPKLRRHECGVSLQRCLPPRGGAPLLGRHVARHTRHTLQQVLHTAAVGCHPGDRQPPSSRGGVQPSV